MRNVPLLPVVLYILLLIAVIVGVDVLFLKGRFWMRLIANICIAAAFAIVYYKLIRNP